MKISKRRFREIVEARLLGKTMPLRHGDWVRIILPDGMDDKARFWEAEKLVGKIGRIIGSGSSWEGGYMAVRFKEHMRMLHTCHGKCLDGHGWYLPHKYLQIITTSLQIKSNKGGAL